MLISNQIENQIISGMNNVLEILSFGPVVNGTQVVNFKCIKWLKLYGVVNGRTKVDSYSGDQVTFIIDMDIKDMFTSIPIKQESKN